MPLTYEQAHRALEAALARAREMSVALSIAVVDEAGYPIALARMDGARPFTADVAVGKAKASAAFGGDSGTLAQRVPPAIAAAANQAIGGRAVFWQGAVPIKAGDQVLGAIGASGSTSENDEAVVRAGAEAL